MHCFSTLLPVLLPLLLIASARGAAEQHAADAGRPQQERAIGVVFHDANGNGARDDGEAGLEDVGVSNGIDVVRTDAHGSYEIPLNDFGVVFVIKPRGFTSPVDLEQMLPRFYYLHRPWGSPGWLPYAGVPATGRAPASIDFPMQSQVEPERFRILVFGDPQSRNLLEVDYLRRDLIEPMLAERVESNAAFGVSLGDLTFDNLHLFEPQNRVIARLGIPWYNVIGNHDINTGQPDRHDDETFERVFGPGTYAFQWGSVFFIVLDNVYSTGDGWKPKFGRERIRFVRNALTMAPPDALVVAMAHCPIGDVHDLQDMFDALASGENGTARRVLFLTAHYHQQFHELYGPEDGWQGRAPLHHLVHATACGNWWGGEKDERGIPDATMRCGTPNGYSIIEFDRDQYMISYRAASMPADYQMSIQFPSELAITEMSDTRLLVNVFSGNEKTRVQARLVSEKGFDTSVVLSRDGTSRHVWVGMLRSTAGEALQPGPHRILVEATDMHGVTHRAEHEVLILPEAVR